ncbi:MAG: choice-of-anchor A family protein [Muribaculaceae bacterium]|nr:choice-of-anchor A family protein [Muribaculaceae bacterium]
MNNDNNKKKILMKSAVAFSFALAMFGANAGADVSAEEALTTGKAGFNSTFDEDGEETDVRQGDEADNGDDTKGISTNMEESAAEEVSAASSLLGAANGFNVFVKGDYSVNGADISSNGQLGNLAAGGNVSVPGDYTAGKVVVGGEVSGSFHNGVSDESIDFDEAFKQLEATSSSLAQLEANGTVSQNQWWGAEINFNGSDPELNVFNITVDEFNAMRANGGGQLSFSFNVPKGSHCIVNIVGEGSVDLSVNAGAFYAKETISNGTANNKNIIFNVPDAESVTIQDNMGALMAVNAKVTSADGVSGNHFEGSLICSSYEGCNEFGANSYDEQVIVNKVTPPAPVEEEKPVEDDVPVEDVTPETPETPDVPDTPVEDVTPETPETPDVPDTPVEDVTPETPEAPDVPDTPVEDVTPETPDTPDVPDTPVEDVTPETPDTPDVSDTPYNPYETIETFDDDDDPEPVVIENSEVSETPAETPEAVETVEFDEPAVPLADTPFEETDEEESTEDTTENSAAAVDYDVFETFDDAPIPLADDPFSNADSATAANPVTGEDLTVPAVSAAAAMAAFLTILYANKKKREDAQG